MPETLHLHTYSPVHVGSGASLEPAEYVIAGGRYYRINPERLFGAILGQHPEAQEQVVRWIEDQAARQERQRNNRAASAQRRQATLFHFVERELRDPSLARKLQGSLASYSRYHMPGPASLGTQVREQLKTATDELYVPGSSIKGALRTALLFDALLRLDAEGRRALVRPLQQAIRTWQQEKRNKRPNKKKLAFLSWPVEDELLGCGYRKKGTGDALDHSDPKFSLMRFLVVSDTAALPVMEAGTVLQVDAYLLSGTVQQQTPPVEAIREGVTLPFRLIFDAAALKRIVEGCRRRERIQLYGERLTMGTEIWVGLEERLQRIFGLSFDDVLQQPEEELERRVIDRVLAACHRMGAAVAAHERGWAEANQGKGSLGSAGRDQLRWYQGLPARTLKLGWASGFAGITLYALLPELVSDPVLGKHALELLALMTGRPEVRAEEVKSVFRGFPKAHRFETRQEGVGLLGWVTISREAAHPVPELAEQEAPAAPAPEPEPVFDPATAPKVDRPGKNTMGIPAQVIGREGRALVVRLHAEGYENARFTVGGVNAADFKVGDWILVDVANMSKKGRVVQVSFGRRL